MTCGFSSAGIALIFISCCFRCRLRGDLGADLGLDEKVKTGGDPFSSSVVRGGFRSMRIIFIEELQELTKLLYIVANDTTFLRHFGLVFRSLSQTTWLK